MDKPFTLHGFLARAVLLGGMFVYLLSSSISVAYGANQPDALVNASADLQISLRWIQPTLGQAILEDALIKRHNGIDLSSATKTPGRATVVAHQSESRTWASTNAAATEMDHAALVQWVMGRIVVDLTRHRIGSGVLTENQLANEGNQQIIAVARQIGQQLHDVFKAERQAALDPAIVRETLNQPRRAERDPEEVGLIF